MTYEEAIEHGYEMLEVFGGDTEKFVMTAIRALEKQMPMKPKKLTYKLLVDSGWKYECPCCGLAIGENSFTDYEYIEPIEPYCGQCGQAIDWSDEE